MSRLEAKNLTLRFGRKTVLDHVSMTMDSGSITVILGPNGAGKSSLLSCLAGLRMPAGGAIELDGGPLSAMAPRLRARRLGYLPQSGEIAWAVDVETLVGLGRIPHHAALGADESDRLAVRKALEMCELVDLAKRPVTQLSGGERMRVLIARVLAGEPEWLLADEPLTGLDLRHRLDAARLLRGFAQSGKGVVMTLHDLDFALRYADRCIVLHEGRILADGPAAAVISPEVVATAYGVSARLVAGRSAPLIEVLDDGDR
jgi:iron complex transport system ATP-binding protein